jgi:hypothetical protein
MSSRHLEVLRLYRYLIKYSQRLKYTDVDFYLTRIKQEFAKGKTLENEDDIVRQIAVNEYIIFFQNIPKILSRKAVNF